MSVVGYVVDVGVEGLLGHGGVAMAVRMFSVDGGCGWAYKWRAARPWKDNEAVGGREVAYEEAEETR